MTTDKQILEHLRKANHHLREIEALVAGGKPPATQAGLKDIGGTDDPPPPGNGP